MPIADLPGIGLRIRTSADATAYAMFLRERGDLLDLHRRAELDLVAGDGRTPGVAGDLGVDAELLQHLGEPLDDRVAGLRPRLVRRAGLEHVVGRQRVGDVAGQRELLDPLRERRVRRRLELAGSPSAAGRRLGGASASADRRLVDGLPAPLARAARGPRAPGCRTPGRPCSGSMSSSAACAGGRASAGSARRRRPRRRGAAEHPVARGSPSRVGTW